MSDEGTSASASVSGSSSGTFSFAGLRRWPDVEADNLHAVDASDRLILDVAAPRLAAVAGRPGEVVVIGDRYGAVTLGAIAGHGLREVRVHQDSITGERALAANAAGAAGLAADAQEFSTVPTLDAALIADARVVLLNLPRGLGELDEIAGLVAAHAHPDVVLVAGGMIKHMSLGMNEVLLRHFGAIDVSLARQKARVITASGSKSAGRESRNHEPMWPKRAFHSDIGMWVCAHGGTFAGTSVDIGTRALLAHLDELPGFDTAMDLGCGTGILATSLARARPGARILATDQSAAAVASARSTAAANEGVVEVFRDDAAAGWPSASVDLVVLNPPFHIGAAVHTGVALKMFEAAARVLRPGGELWAVWNTHLSYATDLGRIVGPTRQVARNAKFTVTASRKV